MNAAVADNPLAGQIVAGLGLLACLAAGVWMLLGDARQQRLRRAWQAWRRSGSRAASRRVAAGSEADPEAARREAQAVIDRARRATSHSVQREGNVLRPDRFAAGRRPDTRPVPRGRTEGQDDGDSPGPTLH
jgi:hypothetical protein